MPQIEFEGKNIDDAVTNACKQLNCKKDNLKFDILSSGSTGIFGLIGAKKAKIRVIENLQSIKKPKDEVSKTPNLKAAQSEGIKSLVDEAFKDTSEEPKSLAHSKPKPKARPQAPAKAPIPESEPDEEFESDSDSITESTREPIVIPESLINSGKEMLQKILDSITDSATVSVKNEGDRLTYHIEGGNSALLIGKRGQTLDAIQYLVDKIVNKQSDDRIRIQIDIEGYLESRQANLESLALRLAEKAKKTGKPSTISQMTAHDRRIVHLALKDDHTVKTRSIGEGYYRRLVIFPKKRKFRKNTKYDTPEAK